MDVSLTLPGIIISIYLSQFERNSTAHYVYSTHKVYYIFKSFLLLI